MRFTARNGHPPHAAYRFQQKLSRSFVRKFSRRISRCAWLLADEKRAQRVLDH